MLLHFSPLELFPLKPSNHVPSDALKLLYTPPRKMDPGGSSGGGEEVTDGRVTNKSRIPARPTHVGCLRRSHVSEPSGIWGVMGSPPPSSLWAPNPGYSVLVVLSLPHPSHPVSVVHMHAHAHTTHTHNTHTPLHAHIQHTPLHTHARLFLFSPCRSLERLPSPDPRAEGHGQSRQSDQDLVTQT